MSMWYRSISDKRDDSILLGVIAEFEKDGMTFASALTRWPGATRRASGILICRRPSAAEMKDVEFGWGLAKEMGRLGQFRHERRWGSANALAARGRGHRGHRLLHRARGHALPLGRMDAREGSEAAAGHAIRRADDRDLDDREPAQGGRPRPRDRGQQDHRRRSGRRGSRWQIDAGEADRRRRRVGRRGLSEPHGLRRVVPCPAFD